MDNNEESFPTPEDLPETLSSLWEHIPPISGNHPNESVNEGYDELVELMRRGKCMTCESPLGQHTLLVIGQYGIVLAFCSGLCLGDMGVWGYLQTQLKDLVERIEFRTQAGGVDGPEAGLDS